MESVSVRTQQNSEAIVTHLPSLARSLLFVRVAFVGEVAFSFSTIGGEFRPTGWTEPEYPKIFKSTSRPETAMTIDEKSAIPD